MFGKLGIGTPAIIFLKKILTSCLYFLLFTVVYLSCLLIGIFVFLVFDFFFLNSFHSVGIDPHLACG